MRVVIATTNSDKVAAFESSLLSQFFKERNIKVEFNNVDQINIGEKRYKQPFTVSGGIYSAMQLCSYIRNGGGCGCINDDNKYISYYDEAGEKIGDRKENDVVKKGDDDLIIIAFENFITENAKDLVCVVVNYIHDGKLNELIDFSPANYIASFPPNVLQHIMTISKYKGGEKGFDITIGDLGEHKLYNSFDVVEQIRGTLNHLVGTTEFNKIFN
jgi:hypothetical protein